MHPQTDQDIEVDAAMAQLGPNFLASVKTPTGRTRTSQTPPPQTASSTRDRAQRGFVVEHIRPRRRSVFVRGAGVPCA